MHDIAFLDDVLLAFQSQPPGFLGPVLTVAGDVVVVGDDLGANKTLLKISVDRTGSFRRRCTNLRRPRADFFRSCRKIGLQSE